MRSLPNSARGLTAGSLVRGLYPVSAGAYLGLPREEGFYCVRPKRTSGSLAGRAYTVFGRSVLAAASRGGLVCAVCEFVCHGTIVVFYVGVSPWVMVDYDNTKRRLCEEKG